MNMSIVITPVVLGLIVSILGISNLRGNIASIHWYHRKRVTEENKAAFGKQIGLGTLIIGVAFVVFGGFAFLTVKTQKPLFIIIGVAILIIAIIVGFAISFHAMIKYNKGVF